jgi:hypothetical protein
MSQPRVVPAVLVYGCCLILSVVVLGTLWLLDRYVIQVEALGLVLLLGVAVRVVIGLFDGWPGRPDGTDWFDE